VAAPRVAIGPTLDTLAEGAVRAAGGVPARPDSAADALVWLAPRDTAGLRAALAATAARWVQLSSAGIELTAAAGLLDHDRVWTSAKGVYADLVAEHAVALALAGLRQLPVRIVARTWGMPGGDSLFDEPVAIIGAGGITASLLRLLAPFRVSGTVVRRGSAPMPGAARTRPATELVAAVRDAKVVFLALALTPETERIIGAPQLAAMRPDAWLVNVARGRHVDTAALVAALAAGSIAGAALDVTDPEPLPDGHPLWAQQQCIITPHTADPAELSDPAFAGRVRENVARFAAGQPLLGVVDPEAGY
jgi:phosphoglycerate dehydrogenase-like enzyme